MISLKRTDAVANEVQLSYFQRTEVSVHVSLIQRHAILEVDGVSSTEMEPNIVEQFLVISSVIKHDQHHLCRLVHIAEYITSICYGCNVMHEYCYGVSKPTLSWRSDWFCQWRKAHSYLKNICFCFESCHAKVPQGAAEGLITNQTDTAVTRGKASVQCAYDLYQFACDNQSDTAVTRWKASVQCAYDLYQFACDNQSDTAVTRGKASVQCAYDLYQFACDNQTDTAVTCGKASVQCAYDLYQFACDNLQKTKSHIFRHRTFR